MVLKACPFCGVAATLRAIHDAFWVGCENGGCAVVPHLFGRSEHEAATRWNKRAPVGECAEARVRLMRQVTS